MFPSPENDYINFQNVDEFVCSTFDYLNIQNKNYNLNIDNLVTSHDFNNKELPWKYPKIIYRIYYYFFKKKIFQFGLQKLA